MSTAEATTTPVEFTESQPRSNEFLLLLEDLGGGTTVYELEEKLIELNKAAELTGKAGSLTLTIAVKPNFTQGRDGMPITQLIIGHDVTRKMPKAGRATTTRFLGPQGQLQVSDHSQRELPLGKDRGGVSFK